MTNHTTCREAFEKWAQGKVCMLDRDPDFGGYVFSAVNAYWIAWQAAWNTRATEGEVERDAAIRKLQAALICNPRAAMTLVEEALEQLAGPSL